MEHTVSLKLNHVFRRLYGRGKSAVNPCLAVYCRKNNLGYSRLGLTVGVKLGKAVVRNRTRRRIKEAYRIHEGAFFPGYDIVVVARVRLPTAVTGSWSARSCLWRTSSACSGRRGA